MPNRHGDNGEVYRYAFNGKEQDPETMGQGNIYDYGFRIYNPRIARFLSVDPLTATFPYYTPYQFAGNKPIAAIDLDGLEEYVVTKTYSTDNQGNVSLHVDFNYVRERNRSARTVDGVTLSANRKGDIIINGQYSRSEMSSFENCSMEARFEVAEFKVFNTTNDRNRYRWQQNGTSQGSGAINTSEKTLKESMEESPFNRGNYSFDEPNRHFNGIYDDQTFSSSEVLFETGSAQITSQYDDMISDAVDNLSDNKELVINLVGNTSASGSTGSNQTLSNDRVNAVYGALTEKLKANGFSDEEISRRVTVTASGESQSQSEGDAESSNDANNRNVTINYGTQN